MEQQTLLYNMCIYYHMIISYVYIYIYIIIYTCGLQQAEIWGWTGIVAFLWSGWKIAWLPIRARNAIRARIAIWQSRSKDTFPEQSGLEFSLACAVQASFENLCQSKSGENTRKTGGNTRETGENSRGKVLSTGHSLFFADSFVQEWRSRNAEQWIKTKTHKFP